MSHSRRLSLEPAIDSLTARFNGVAVNKPDFRELDLGSPVSPLMPRGTAATAATATATSSGSSSSSSGKASTTATAAHVPKNGSNNHSGELSGLPRNPKMGHRRSASAGAPLIYSGSSFSTFSSTATSYNNNSSCSGGGAGSSSSGATSSPCVLPSGNICPSGKILKTGMASRASSRPETLCTGTGNYGHGSIVRGGGGGGGNVNGKGNNYVSDPEEVKRLGNEMYRKGNFLEALALYEKAISLSPENAAFRSNRAAALTAVGRLGEAVKECEEAVRLDPLYARAHQRLASLYLRLGEAENARRHLCYSGQCPDHAELQRLQTLEKHLRRCADARKIGDWKSAIRETDAALAIGADSSPQLVACKAEALLRLHQIEDADSCLSNIPKLDYYNPSTPIKVFGMVSEAYVLYVQAQVDMALGRFENAVTKAEKAALLDYNNPELAMILSNVKMVTRARSRGNELFSSGRYSEACAAYGEGLKYNTSNSVLYCNRAACWSKLGLWEKSVEDCNQALKIQHNYAKALLRRAASYGKLGRWAEAVRDYEVLRKQLPVDNEVLQSLQHAQAALNRSREFRSTEFNSEVEEVSSLDKFKSAISLPGVSVIHFKAASNEQCEQISPFINTLCVRYPLVHFYKVDVEESLALAKAESIRAIPTFKIYKNGDKVKEMVRPSHQLLEESVRNYIL